MSGNNNKSSILEINRQRFITRARGERERQRDRDRETEIETDKQKDRQTDSSTSTVAVNRRHQLIQQSVIKAFYHRHRFASTDETRSQSQRPPLAFLLPTEVAPVKATVKSVSKAITGESCHK